MNIEAEAGYLFTTDQLILVRGFAQSQLEQLVGVGIDHGAFQSGEPDFEPAIKMLQQTGGVPGSTADVINKKYPGILTESHAQKEMQIYLGDP